LIAPTIDANVANNPETSTKIDTHRLLTSGNTKINSTIAAMLDHR